MIDQRTAFNSEQYEHTYPDGIEAHYWTNARNRIVRRRLAEALDGRGRRHGRILDVGCGRGITVEYLRHHGFDVWGCDVGTPLPFTREVAPYLRLGVDALALDQDTTDGTRALLMLDMLEHIPDPRSFLASCRKRFTHCDTVLITLPARMEIWSNYDEYYGHFRRYDSASLKDMVPDDAFEIVEQRYCFRLLYPPARILSSLGMKRATEVSAPSAGSRGVHRALGALFALEERLVPGFVPGTSLLAVLRARA